MNDAIEIQTNEDLAFFGKINASISHELKNILAIISETSGLLNDLAELVEKGKNIDTGMIKTCSQDIVEGIQRGFATVKEMNTFSHSVDNALTDVSLVEMINHMVNIASYLSYASKVRINTVSDADPVILTCPFRLQHLIYSVLVFGFGITGPEGEIQLSVHKEKDNQARIHFSNFGTLSEEKFPLEQMLSVADSIDAKICLSDDLQSIDIFIPETIQHII